MPQTEPAQQRPDTPEREARQLYLMGMVIGRLDTRSAAKSGMERQEGLMVKTVRLGSMADLAGVTSGDIICEVAGIPVLEPADLERLLAEHEPYRPVGMLFRRVGAWRYLALPAGELFVRKS